jgi:transporter family-2 protein
MSIQALSLTLVALLAGGLIALQAPINAEAASRLGHPVAAATLSFFVGTAALTILTLIFARQSAPLETLKALPLCDRRRPSAPS